ncbi:MAG TPA: tetratricopeptide repeat protein [Flavobacteriales bacterium]|nr:tetratricopeptide repeat protein [Flavobacteriales bacterium]
MIRPIPYLQAPLVQFVGALVLCALAAGCSTEKDAFLNRTYHRLTARDNGWFNANEKLNETITGIEDAHEDNYDEVLPIFVYGTEEQAKAAIPDLETCIEKCSVVIDRHSMTVRDKERNTWIDDAHFVIGKAQFYKRTYVEAERMFAYISRRYKDHDKQLPAKLWQARTHIQLERYAKAQSDIDEILDEKELPKRFPHAELAAVQADLDLKRGKVDDAIVHLERAVDLARDKRERVRWAFVLAQLYEAKGMEDKAIAQYEKITRMNPPYEIAFHAQIFQALAFDRGNSKALRQKLNRMLKDDKHRDHFDMIHYALADLDFKEGQDSSAVAHLRTSCQVSTTDIKQKSKSYLRLADHYFDGRDYGNAQLYYDSTSTVMAEEHPRFEEVLTRAEVLGELVEQLAIIELEDSLQAMASMDENEREKLIRERIRERERAEEEKARLETAAREALEQGGGSGGAKPTGGGGGGGAWYFSNPQAMDRGISEFRKRWGRRELEDDWRRRDKSGTAAADLADMETEEAAEELAQTKEGEPEWKDPQFYLKDLPMDDAAISASNAKVCEALYISGMIYKEKLKDTDNAVESFEVLNNRFDDCRYTPESYYQLYRIYLDKERSQGFIDFGGGGSAMYANVILDRWPDSEFARLVQNPDLLGADSLKHQQEVTAYEEVYGRFRMRAYTSVITSCNNVIAQQPGNHLLPKYYMLKAMAVGGTRQESAFREALQEVKSKFPGTDEEKAATELLAALDGRGGAEQRPPGKGEDESPYMTDSGNHYVVLIVPNADGPVNVVKNKIADFARAYFPGMTLDIQSSFLDKDHQVVLMSLFDTKVKAMEFYDLFLSDKSKLTGINDKGYAVFAISPDNYSTLYKSKDVEGYTAFFTTNYLQGQ